MKFLSGLITGVALTYFLGRGRKQRMVRPRDIVVRKTITVDAPIDRVFDVWSRLDNFPRFMDHVRAVIVDGKRSLWRVDGPEGTVIEYESEVTKLEPDRVIEWQTTPGQPIEHRGRVRFDAIDGATRLHVEMTYCPPAGTIGPEQGMEVDLARMKALLEDRDRMLFDDLR